MKQLLFLAVCLFVTSLSAQQVGELPAKSVDTSATQKVDVSKPVTSGEDTSKSEVTSSPDAAVVSQVDESAITKVTANANDALAFITNEILFKALFFDVAFGAVTTEDLDEKGQVQMVAPEPSSEGVNVQEMQVKMKVVEVPFIVALLFFGAIFFTLRYSFINLRLFKHGIQVVRGKFDKEGDSGDINHFKALTSALSATVGLGNIAAVALAINQGGPGALF